MKHKCHMQYEQFERRSLFSLHYQENIKCARVCLQNSLCILNQLLHFCELLRVKFVFRIYVSGYYERAGVCVYCRASQLTHKHMLFHRNGQAWLPGQNKTHRVLRTRITHMITHTSIDFASHTKYIPEHNERFKRLAYQEYIISTGVNADEFHAAKLRIGRNNKNNDQVYKVQRMRYKEKIDGQN